MLQRFIMVLVVVAIVSSGWTIEPLLAAPTKAQRTELNLISKDLLKAGNLYAQGKYKESGRLIRMVQGRLEKLAESKDPALHRLMGGTINGLKKAHALLEIEGV